MKQRIITFLLLSASFINHINAQSFKAIINPPKHEVRAVWLTTIGGLDWPDSYSATVQQRQLCDILDKLKAANINTVLLQTRIRATTIYNSSIEPYDGCITGHPGRQPSYDPLAFAIEECHRRGMEIHAWVVAIPVGKWNGYGCRQLRKQYPSIVKKIGDEGFLNPEKEETAHYVASLCEEIVKNYDVDGIHLDYIRYPETWKNIGNRDVARNNITRIVRSVSDRVKALRKWIKVSVAPIGKRDDLSRYSSNGWNAYSRVCQDVEQWMKEDLVDMIFPMMYFRDNNFYPFLLDWKERSHDKIVVPGLGIYFMSPSEKNWPASDIMREIDVSRSLDMGFAMFRTKHFLDNTKGIYASAQNGFAAFPALIPPVNNDNSTPPVPPSGIETIDRDDDITVRWNGSGDCFFNVYASYHYPIDINDAKNLIASRRQSAEITIKKLNTDDRKLFFAVTQVDRFGRESEPIFNYTLPEEISAEVSSHSNILFINNDETIDLSRFSQISDFKKVIITDLNNQIIAVLNCNNNYHIDVSNINKPSFIVRTINKKGISHRLGFVFRDNSSDLPK